jgi:uncharacterized protein (TIRG00374 family)
MNKNRLFFFLRFFISFFIIVFIISKVDFNKVIDLLPKIKLHFILIGLLWLLLDRVVMSYRWAILLRTKEIKIPLFNITKIYFLSSFWGTFLPSSVAPDVIKVYVASKHNSNTSDVVSSVVVDRIIGLFSLSLVAFLSLLVVLYYRRMQEYSMQGYSSVFLVVLIILFLTTLLPFFDRLPLKKVKSRFHFLQEGILWKFLAKFYNSCKEYKTNKTAIFKVFSVSLINHILAISMIYVLSLSLGLQISVLYLFIFIPLINFLIMIPISIGGLGIQEGAYVYFLSQIGMSVQEALTIALVFRVLMIIASLPGGVVYISEGFQVKKAVT